MSVGRIRKNKIIEFLKLKKYQNFLIPIKDKNKWNYKCVDFINKDEFIYKADILSVFSEYCNDSLIFYYSYGIEEKISSHDHTFDAVLETLYDFPESFNIPKEYEKYYSVRELEFLKKLQEKLLKDGLKDIGKFYKEHPMKKDYELHYIEYNYDELRKRNIKKIQGINIKTFKKF